MAIRAGKLIPVEGPDRSPVISWIIAALNSVEPFLMNVAEVEYFIEDEVLKDARRPEVVAAAEQRLAQLETAIGDRLWLVGDGFTVADLMTSSVLKIARRLDLLENHLLLKSYQDRCLDRPAYRKAVADQLATIELHDMEDMHFNDGASANG